MGDKVYARAGRAFTLESGWRGDRLVGIAAHFLSYNGPPCVRTRLPIDALEYHEFLTREKISVALTKGPRQPARSIDGLFAGVA